MASSQAPTVLDAVENGGGKLRRAVRISKVSGTVLVTDLPAFMGLDELAGAIRIAGWYLNLDRERG